MDQNPNLVTSVIDTLCHEHNIPTLSLENFIKFAKRTIIVYDLRSQGKRIEFSNLCEYVYMFSLTPFGLKILKELSEE
jgi:hypothetical protein